MKMAENNHFILEKDRFGCVKINTNTLPSMTEEELSNKLTASIPKWTSENVRGVWAKINIKHSRLVPVFVESGFQFHHAQPKYVMLKKWISESEPDTIPAYANQYLGAGGFVVNDKNQLLVIQERFHTKPHWKLPGGLADPGEDIGEAAQREVLEETGIQTEFRCIVSFRHMHNYKYGCSDFYFICLLRPLSDEITKCENEIAEAKWIDLDEYINHPNVSDANRHFAQCYKDMVTQGTYCLKPKQILNFAKTGYNLVYSVDPVNMCQNTQSLETDLHVQNSVNGT